MGLHHTLISTIGSLISALVDLLALTSGDIRMFPKPGAIQQAFGQIQSETTFECTNKVASVAVQRKEEVFSEKSPVADVLEDIHANPDISLSVPEMIQKYGFPLETHEVVTEDGYKLSIFRIPHGRKGQRLCSRPPVLLMHGLLNSSSAWVINHPDKALAYSLADQGYDCWLANSRGSIYARGHENMSPNDKEYWEFSFHEMGRYDVPAIIKLILDTTGHPNLFYIGHSLGNTMLMIAAHYDRELSEKIKLFIAFAPAVYLYMTTAKVISIPSPFFKQQKTVLDFLTRGELMPKTFVQALKSRFPFVPTPEYWGTKIITTSMKTIGGYNPDQIDWPRLPVVAGHTPSSTSVRTYIHCLQYFNSDKFQAYDFGNEDVNENNYGQQTPPVYDLSCLKCPTVIYWGENDLVCRPEGVKRLASELPNVVSCNKVPCELFTHTDFLYAKDADVLVYNDVIQTLDSVFK